jgi:hypothetical protein
MGGEAGIQLRRRELVLAALALLGGCGGGVGSGGTGTGLQATLAVGPITGFGSIIVNGVRYDDTQAAITDDDGRALSRNELALGMQTEVLASAVMDSAGVRTATASSIRLRSEIVGPLQAIDAGAGRLQVLGQGVDLHANTVFDAALANGVASLTLGGVLEVYALFDAATGRYVASRIERRSAVTAYKLRGVVGTLNLGARTLTIGGATIDWAAVAPSNPGTVLASGRTVRVTLATTPVAGVWRALSLQTDTPVLADRDRAEIEGRIDRFTSTASFSVGGVPVDASAATFPNGTAGLALGIKVEVKGSIRNGIVLATEVKLEDDDDEDQKTFELKGTISAANALARTFVVRGTTVVWSDATQFDSSTPADIVDGRRVEVKGQLTSDGTRVQATKVHVEG